MRSHAPVFGLVPTRRITGSVVGLLALATGVSVVAADPNSMQAGLARNPPGQVQAHAMNSHASDAPLNPATPDMKAVQDLLGRTMDDVANGRGPDLIALLSRADRGRLNAPADWPDVDHAAEAFRNAWQAKFGTSFKVGDKISVVMSEPNVHVSGLEPVSGGSTTAPAAPVRKTTADVTLEGPARRTATNLHLLNEGTDKPDWHVDLPDSVTADSLHDSLIRHLNTVTADQNRWPTDVDQAYVYVTEHLLSAVGDAAKPR
jgi:hypothetical protein